jgi:hypothetical protein
MELLPSRTGKWGTYRVLWAIRGADRAFRAADPGAVHGADLGCRLPLRPGAVIPAPELS